MSKNLSLVSKTKEERVSKVKVLGEIHQRQTRPGKIAIIRYRKDKPAGALLCKSPKLWSEVIDSITKEGVALVVSSMAQFITVLDHLPEMLWQCDLEGNLRWTNAGFEKMFLLAGKEGRAIMDIMTDASAAGFRLTMNKAEETGSINEECPMLCADGLFRQMKIRGELIRLEDQAPYLSGTAEEVQGTGEKAFFTDGEHNKTLSETLVVMRGMFSIVAQSAKLAIKENFNNPHHVIYQIYDAAKMGMTAYEKLISTAAIEDLVARCKINLPENTQIGLTISANAPAMDEKNFAEVFKSWLVQKGTGQTTGRQFTTLFGTLKDEADITVSLKNVKNRKGQDYQEIADLELLADETEDPRYVLKTKGRYLTAQGEQTDFLEFAEVFTNRKKAFVQIKNLRKKEPGINVYIEQID